MPPSLTCRPSLPPPSPDCRPTLTHPLSTAIASSSLPPLQELCQATVADAIVIGLWHDKLTGQPHVIVLSVLCDIARGVAYIHSKNIIHGKFLVCLGVCWSLRGSSCAWDLGAWGTLFMRSDPHCICVTAPHFYYIYIHPGDLKPSNVMLKLLGPASIVSKITE